jgi:uncharacterized protein
MLIRFVRAPDGAIAMDVTGKMNQRGAWTCPDAACIEKAIGQGRFARAFSAPVIARFESLLEQIVRILRAEVLGALGLARTAGLLIAGRTEVIDAMKRDVASFILLSEDLAVRSVRDIESERNEQQILRGFSKTDMGKAIGRKPTGVMALEGRSPLALRIATNLSRLSAIGDTVQSPDIERDQNQKSVKNTHQSKDNLEPELKTGQSV